MCNLLLFCLHGILVCFLASTVAREAIINGDIATAHQFPFQATLIDHQKYICGGGIIGDQFVLTAAHCVFNKDHHIISEPLYVLAGTNDLNKPGEKHKVEKVFVPKKYKPEIKNSDGDIAVLMLKNPLGLAKHRKKLKELKLPRNDHARYINKTAEIAAFGWTWINIDDEADTLSGGRNDSLLRYAKADVIAEHHESSLETVFGREASQEHIIAIMSHDYSRHQAICFGDSGAPLVHDGTVIGIVYGTTNFCSESWSGSIYTRVTRYLDFIEHAKHDCHQNDTLSYEL